MRKCKNYSQQQECRTTFCRRLLVNLTIPTLLLYNEELPTDKVSSQQYLEMVGHLQRYKQAFAAKQVWNILSEKLTQLLKLVREPIESRCIVVSCL